MIKYKQLVLPIIAVIGIILQLVFNIKLPDELQNSLAEAIGNLVAIVLVIIGIFRNNIEK